MINLLPMRTKLGFRYGRRNRHLLRWVLTLLIGLLGVVLITAGGFVYLHQLSTSYSKQISLTKKQLEAQRFDEVNAQIKDMSNNLQLTVQVLSKQILFSELLQKLSTLLPKDTILSSLAVTDTQGALDITAKAKDYAAATQIQVNLSAKENGIFSKVDIIGINCGATSGAGAIASAYPCTVTIRALFAPNSPFAVAAKSNTGATR